MWKKSQKYPQFFYKYLKDTDSLMFMVSTVNTPIEFSQTFVSIVLLNHHRRKLLIASADSKESDQTAHKSLPIINHFKFLRKTVAIISLCWCADWPEFLRFVHVIRFFSYGTVCRVMIDNYMTLHTGTTSFRERVYFRHSYNKMCL